MSQAKPEPEDDDDAPKGPPRGLAVGVWGLVLFTGCRLLEIFLEAQATASAVGQAVLVEWAGSRLGVVWVDPAEPLTGKALARRIALGASAGLVPAAALVAVLLGSRGATFESVASPPISLLVIGLLTAGLHAWRDEILQHGIVLRALGMWDPGDQRGRPHDLLRVVACGVTSAGAALGRSDASARSIVSATLVGMIFGALWVHGRGAWMPWAARTAFQVTTNTLIAGGLVQMRLTAGAWSGGDSGLFSGTAAVVALAPVAILALFAIVRRISPDPVRVG